MPLKYFLSSTCAESGRLFGYNFVIFLGQFLQNNNHNYVCYYLRNRFYLYLPRIIGLSVINGNAFEIRFVKNLCRVRTTFRLQFVTFLGQFLQNHTNNYVCYSAKYIRFIFIKYYWLQSKGNAFEKLFVKNLCRVGTTFRLRFFHILGQFLQNNTNNYGFYMWNRLNLYSSRIIGLKVKEMPLKYFLVRTCAGLCRLFGYNFMTFWASFYRTILIIMAFICGIE